MTCVDCGVVFLSYTSSQSDRLTFAHLFREPVAGQMCQTRYLRAYICSIIHNAARVEHTYRLYMVMLAFTTNPIVNKCRI